jgi:AraC-like DNA-binding protein
LRKNDLEFPEMASRAAFLRALEQLMRTKDIDELTDAVSKIYCEHTVRVTGAARNVDGRLDVTSVASQPMVHLAYGAPVNVDAGNFTKLFLIKHCVRGAASASQDGQTAEWRQGQTMILSAGRETELKFDHAFLQRSVRLEIDKLEATCTRWLGHPLERPLQFALRPFSDALEQVWRQTLLYTASDEMGGPTLSGPAKESFDEYLRTLLLHQHAHNYSEELTDPSPAPLPRLVRRAERYIAENAALAITLPDVAAALGVSVRTLQNGFRQWRDTTPHEFLRQTRLRLVHDELCRSVENTDVTTVALRHGFTHMGRFSAYYQSAFGELPSTTLRRRRPTHRRAKL